MSRRQRVRRAEREERAVEAAVHSGLVVEAQVRRGLVLLESRPDPDAPARSVRRGVAMDHLERLRRLHAITVPEHEAAIRWRELEEAVAGARDRPGVVVRTDGGGAPGGGVAAFQVEAAAELRGAADLLGHPATRLVRSLVVEGQSVRAIAEAIGEDQRVAMGRLRGALERLAAHWRL